MKSLRSSLAFVVVSALLACPPTRPTSEDAGPEEEVPYEGEATNGAIPILENRGPAFQPVDAGEFAIDRRCCQLVFSIDDLEPSDVIGSVEGAFGPLAVDGGLRLSRDGGRWAAASCFPLGTSTSYQYVFTQWQPADGGAGDGGADGGTWQRYGRVSEGEASLDDGLGGRFNVVPAVTSCAQLDASVGMLP